MNKMSSEHVKGYNGFIMSYYKYLRGKEVALFYILDVYSVYLQGDGDKVLRMVEWLSADDCFGLECLGPHPRAA